jgi:hypothetical protein
VIQCVFELLGRNSATELKVQEKSRIDGTASGAHHESFERRQAHGGVDGSAVSDCGDGRAASQMRDDHARAIRGTVQHLHGTLSPVGVTQTVEPEPPKPPARCPLARQRIGERLGRQRRVEGRVEHGYVWDTRQQRHCGVDDRETGRVVKRRELVKLVQAAPDFGSDADGLGETRAAVHHPVHDPFDSTHRLQRPPRPHFIDDRADALSLAALVLHPDPLIDGVDDAVLQAARPRVQYQQPHRTLDDGQTVSAA